MFKKIIISTILSLVCISGFGQDLNEESIIVKGSISYDNVYLYSKFNKDMFCFLKGDYKLYDRAIRQITVEEVIKGEYLPTKIKVVLLNNVGLLPSFAKNNESFIFHIKQFPNTRIYYSDSVELINPNERYIEEVEKTNKFFLETVNTLETGIIEKVKYALDNTNKIFHDYYDFRYIKYILPLLKLRGEIKGFDILQWHGVDDKGNMISGSDTIYKVTSFSDYLYGYLERLPIPVIRPYEKESEAWKTWYNNLFNVDCLPKIDFVPSEHKNILKIKKLYCFQFNNKEKSISFQNENEYFKFTNSEELIQYNLNSAKTMSCKNVKMGKRAYNFIGWDKLLIGEEYYNVFYEKQHLKIRGMNFGNNVERTSIELSKSNNDLIVAWGQDIREQNSLKIGKLSTDGKWIIKPKSIFEYKNTFYINSTPEISSVVSLHLEDESNLIVFPVTNYKKRDVTTIFFKKVDSELNVLKTNSAEFKFENYSGEIREIYLRKTKDGYLLLFNIANTGGEGLYYMLLDENLSPKTEFICLSEYLGKMSAPVAYQGNYIISWIESGLVKSATISNNVKETPLIINITDLEASNIYPVVSDNKFVDFYIFSKENESLIRKRVDINEYK